MIKKIIFAAALLLALAPVAAKADCPTNLPFNEVSAKAAELHLTITKVNDVMAAAIDKVAGRPEGMEDTEMFLMSNQENVAVLLVKEGVIVCTSPPIEKNDFNKLIGLTDANG